MQDASKSSFDFLPDNTVRYSAKALRHIKCTSQLASKQAEADSDPQSPERASTSPHDTQSEQPVGHLSPQQLHEVEQQHQEAHLQMHQQYSACCSTTFVVGTCHYRLPVY